MRFHYLTTEEMASTFSFILNRQRDLLQSMPKVAPLIPDLEAALGAVRQFAGAELGAAAEADLTAAAASLDDRFDHRLAGVFDAFNAAWHGTLSLEVPATGDATRIEQMRDLLFPEGKAITQRAFEVQAGFAERLEALLTPDVRAFLATLPAYPYKSMLEAVTGLCELGRQLGDLEQRRAQQAAIEQERPKRDQARNLWINEAGLLVINLKATRGQDEAVNAVLLSLSNVVDAAVIRAASRKG